VRHHLRDACRTPASTVRISGSFVPRIQEGEKQPGLTASGLPHGSWHQRSFGDCAVSFGIVLCVGTVSGPPRWKMVRIAEGRPMRLGIAR